jgi:transcriptional regulator with XRE-family HTH domain
MLMTMTPDQLRAARALLRLEQDELARRAHVSVVTIRRLEAAQGAERVAEATLNEVRRTLEEAGAEFIEGGVRRRRTARPEAAALFEELRAISLRSAKRLQGGQQFTEADLYDEAGLPA